MYFVFLLSYTNTCESLGELKKAVETLACSSSSHSVSRSPKLPFVFVQLDRNTVHVFYFLSTIKVSKPLTYTFRLVSKNNFKNVKPAIICQSSS